MKTQKTVLSVDPNDVDILRAAALCKALPDDQRCIAYKCVSVRPLLTALSERNSEHDDETAL
jgi:hypothetical protein